MTEDQRRQFARDLMSQTGVIEPGTEMYVILHTGDDGLVPPPEDAPEGSDGTGSGHCFGPFVTKEEAEEWQDFNDRVNGGCSCRRAVLPVIVPRILAVVGPAGVPLSMNDESRKDRLN